MNFFLRKYKIKKKTLFLRVEEISVKPFSFQYPLLGNTSNTYLVPVITGALTVDQELFYIF